MQPPASAEDDRSAPAGRWPGTTQLLGLVAAGLQETPPIYLVAGAILTGDALGNLRWHVPLAIAAIAGAVALILFLSARPAAALAIALFAIAAAATVPAYRLLAPPLDRSSIRNFPDGSQITLEGRLVREVERYHGRLHLFVAVKRAGETQAALRTADGLIRLTVLNPSRFRVGDEVLAQGRLRLPRNFGNPGEFDYAAYLARNGIAATMVVTRAGAGHSAVEIVGYRPRPWASSIEQVRTRIGRFIDDVLPPLERAEMRALVIGDRGEISDRLRDTFALTGMAHLLVISGLHLGIVAAAAFIAARFVLGVFPILMIRGYANKLAALAAALAVIGYASIAAHHVSTTRALVMVLAYLFAIIVDRAREVLASLALAAIVICLALPGSTADVAFQLSFASVLAIVLGMRRFALWWKRRWRRPILPGASQSRANRVAEVLVGYLAVSFWALLGTAPLTAYHFNQFALVGLVANAVVVPVMAAGGTVLGLAAAALSFVIPPLARDLLWVAGRLLTLGTWFAGWFVTWPLAWTRIFTPTWLELAIAYGFVGLWLVWPPRAAEPPAFPVDAPASQPSRDRSPWRRGIFAGLLVALILDAAWWIRQRDFNPELRVTFLSVGQGDAAVIRFPGSRVMLIDGGGSIGEFDPGERIVAPYLWASKVMTVDYLVLSHPELDHFGGFDFIARNFHPGEFWSIRAASPDLRYRDLLAVLAELRVRLRLIDTASAPRRIGGVELRCLNPRPGEIASRNNSSLVLKLSYGASSFLFPGDLEAPGERMVTEDGAEVRATVLKAPHHGSATSSTEAFLEAVHPGVVVISDGYRNRFGFPAPEVVDRYRALGATLLRTDRDGGVEIDSDGVDLTLTTDSHRWRRSASVVSDRLKPAGPGD